MADDNREDKELERRLITLEETAKQHAKCLEEQGGTLDHVVNTIDAILMPGHKVHQEKIVELRMDFDKSDGRLQEIHDYVTSQKGAWAFIAKAAVVIAAISSLVVLILKLMGK